MAIRFGEGHEIRQVAAKAGGVPGRQTVPGAEAFAFAKLVDTVTATTTTNSTIQHRTDATYVTRGVSHMQNMIEGRSGDRWERTDEAQRRREVPVTANRSNSHADEAHAVNDNITLRHVGYERIRRLGSRLGSSEGSDEQAR